MSQRRLNLNLFPVTINVIRFRAFNCNFCKLILFSFTAVRNVVAARYCFYTCLWFCSRGGRVWQESMRGRIMQDTGHVWWGYAWQGVCMAGGMHGRGACMAGGCTWHPTGMHSCFTLFLNHEWKKNLTSNISNLSLFTFPQVFFNRWIGLMFIPAKKNN